MERMFKYTHLREYFQLSVGFLPIGLMMSLSRMYIRRFFFKRLLLLWSFIFVSLISPIVATPMTSYLEITLTLSGELLSGNQQVVASLFDQQFTPANTKWSHTYSSINFENGVASIPIGPLNETDLVMTSPNIHLQIGSESIVIELDSRFYALQSKISEKTLQLYDTDALYIDSSTPTNKKIGIGTGEVSNLSDKLVLNGNLKFTQANTGILFDGMSTAITGSASFENLLTPLWVTNNTSIFYSSGNVGIGVNAPQATLHVSGNVIFDGLISSNSSTVLVSDNGLLHTRQLPASSFAGFENNSLGIFIGTNTPTASLEVFPTTNLNNILIARPDSSSTSGLFIKNSGKVGIGIVSPSALLEISSNSSDDLFIAKSSTTDQGLYIINDGKVGINTPTPSTDIDVSGNINIMGEIKLNNTVFFTSPSTTNVFVGHESGLNYSSGNNNTFLGNESGKTQTGADNNTFIGYQSGLSNLTGSHNTGLGAYSLKNVTNHNNVALGFKAGYSLQGGSQNTIIGSFAAASANSAIASNVIIGYESGKNMSGNSNTFIGYQAGKDVIGNNNILIGHQAGKNLGTTNNIFMIADERTTSSKVLLFGDLDTQRLAVATTNLSPTNKSLFVDGIVEVQGVKYPDGTIQTTYLGSQPGYVWEGDGTNIYFPEIQPGGGIGPGTVKIGTHGAPIAGNPRLLIRSALNQTTLQLEGSSGVNNHGGSIYFGDGDNVYIKELLDDELTILSSNELKLITTTLNIITSGNISIPSLNTTNSATHALVIDSNDFLHKRPLTWTIDSNNNISRLLGNLSIGTSNTTAQLVVQNSSSNQDILKLVGNSGNNVRIDSNGNLFVSGNLTIGGSFQDSNGNAKTFVIDHPIDNDRYLVHATLEGPEAAVYYRGKGTLRNGKVVITLPDYFESLTHKENRTVQLNSENGWSPLFVKDGIKNGQFIVQTTSNGNPSQDFNWVVTAERKDISKLEVEPLKSSIKVRSFGPYTYSEKISP